jgi:hypothetical protein
MAIEFFVDSHAAAARSRFRISFVLVWTTVLAVLLGGVSQWGSQSGWRVADVTQWGFFFQLVAVGTTGAILAGAVYGGLRVPRHRLMRSLGCLIPVALTAAASPRVFALLFADVGAMPADMVWLFGCQGLFLIVSLVPLQALREAGHK